MKWHLVWDTGQNQRWLLDPERLWKTQEGT